MHKFKLSFKLLNNFFLWIKLNFCQNESKIKQFPSVNRFFFFVLIIMPLIDHKLKDQCLYFRQIYTNDNYIHEANLDKIESLLYKLP